MSDIFQRIEAHQGELPWGRFLDAGTGWSSLRWALNLPTESVTAVTGSAGRLSGLQQDFGPQLRGQDRLLCGNWVEESFLAGERFQTVLVDYLVGAMDRFAPYYQTRIFTRLRRLVEGRLYVVGLEPYPEPGPGQEDGELLQQLVALRDATILLSGDRPHREFPRWWIRDQLNLAGYEILEEETFPILYGEQFVKAELDVCLRCMKKTPKALQPALANQEKSLRKRLLERVKSRPLSWGNDYLLVAK